MKKICFIIFFIFIFQGNAFSSGKGKIALVFGNSDYKVNRLRNPANDAGDIAAKLENLGFDVIKSINADKSTMEDSIHFFYKKLLKSEIGLFYYAGHGMQVDGINYLLPLRISVTSKSDVKRYGVPAETILGKMEDAKTDLNIIILDACRNNPFNRSFSLSSKGWLKMAAPTGSIIAYATRPGSTASDNLNGNNGLYTKYLLKFMDIPGWSIEKIFKNTRIAVYNETGGEQIPTTTDSLLGDFFFVKNTPADSSDIDIEKLIVKKEIKQKESQKIRKKFKNKFGMEFVQIFPGKFMMGSPKEENNRDDDEILHEVEITASFYMMSTPVTQKMYKDIMGSNPSRFDNCSDCPVENVSWNDAQRFINKLNKKDRSYIYALPSEAEWEYCCRAGTATAYSWGDSPNRRKANSKE